GARVENGDRDPVRSLAPEQGDVEPVVGPMREFPPLGQFFDCHYGSSSPGLSRVGLWLKAWGVVLRCSSIRPFRLIPARSQERTSLSSAAAAIYGRPGADFAVDRR